MSTGNPHQDRSPNVSRPPGESGSDDTRQMLEETLRELRESRLHAIIADFRQAVNQGFGTIREGARFLAARLAARFPGLEEAIRRLRHGLIELTSRATAAYVSLSWARAALVTVLTLALLFFLDSITGSVGAFTLIYTLPIWFAARLSGGGAGFFAMLLVGSLLTITDGGRFSATGDDVVLNFVIRWIGLGGFLITVLQIENSLKSARHQSTHDPLTGLVNRTTIAKRAAHALERCPGNGRVHIAVVDCDNFKALNDEFGHAFGDHALKVLATKLEAVARESGRVGRMGGDEFVILFERIELREARAALEKANSGFKKILATMGGRGGLSYGIATCGADGDSFDKLLRIADERMYHRKRTKGAGAVAAIAESRSRASVA